jgi:hypothetical protein
VKKIMIIVMIIVMMIVMIMGCKSRGYTNNDRLELRRVIEVKIDSKFTTQEIEEIDSGIIEWNRALNGGIEIRISIDRFDMSSGDIEAAMRGEKVLVMKIDEGSGILMGKGDVLGFTDRIGGNMVYLVGSRGSKRGVLIHEMGHILGVRHQSSGIMVKDWGGDGCIDIVTIREVERESGIRGMNYCL